MGQKHIAKTITTNPTPERAFLVSVIFGNTDKKEAEYSLDELERLAVSAGAKVIGKFIQRLRTPSKNYYLGKGKLSELIDLKRSTDYTVVLFDDELSPLQQRHLEDALQVKIIDRAALILDVFSKRARTREGQLQVELAQHQYLLPRLAGQWSHLDRLGGGIGTRGPGESQLETDRRRAQQRIHILKNKIGKVRKQRKLYRRKRKKNELPIIALVGYTNTGKSTILNKLTKADVSVEDKLFATLDPTTRRLVLSDNNIALVTDTVGFIRKLPPTIISAFQATLEELSEADLLIKVIDLSLPDAVQQDKIVEEILTNLRLDDKPKITVFNKIDLIIENNDDRENILKSYMAEEDLTYSKNIILMSATMGWGLSELRNQILDLLK